VSSPWTSRGQACSELREREAEDKVCDTGFRIREPALFQPQKPTEIRGSSFVAGPAVDSCSQSGPGLTLSRSRCEPAPSKASTRCRIQITGIACSAQIPASVRTLYRTQLRILLVYPLVFMIIRRCRQYTHSRLQFGLHRVKTLVPDLMQISHRIYHSVPSPFPSIHGRTFALSCTTPIFQHEWLSLSFT
jgi:hypothetical protein